MKSNDFVRISIWFTIFYNSKDIISAKIYVKKTVYVMFLAFLLLRFNNRWLTEVRWLLFFSQFIWLKQWLYAISVYFLFEIVLHNSAFSVYVFIKVWHPYHNKLIFSTCGEIVAFLVKLDCLYFSFMPKDSPTQSALFQVPDLYFTFIRNWSHVISKGMKSQSVHSFIMSIVMLNQFTQTCVPQLNCTINSRCRNTGSIRCKFTW